MRVFFVLLLVLVPAVAMAAAMPRYNVEAYCKNVQNVSGGSAMIYNGCIQNEQTSYNHLKATWGRLPAKVQGYCDQVGQAVGGSYLILKGCVDNEMNAMQGTKSFKY